MYAALPLITCDRHRRPGPPRSTRRRARRRPLRPRLPSTLFGFEVAYLGWRASQTTELAAHCRYFSPEQTRGEIATAATEVYSIASILYRLLTGRPPFESENLTFLIEQTLHVKPDPPTTLVASVPRELSDVILKGLAKKPEERYRSIAEFVVALESSY